jgi:pimeloyl-ACP methyl ester carboxylesterase
MENGLVTSADGTPIAYSVWGSGEQIIIIDGATAHRATTPENAQAAELLADDFLVINYDRRGRGDSGDGAPYAVEREFEDLAAVIEQAGEGGPATVFAWSSGGLLALNAAQNGVAMNRMALFEPPVVVDDSSPPLPDDYVERLDAAVASGRRGDAVQLFMTAAAGMPEDEEMFAAMRASDMWSGLEAIAHTIAYDGRQVGDTMSGRPLRPDLWDEIDIPVLVMHGTETWPFLITGSEAVAAHLPTATLKPVPGENHSTTPDVLANALREFVRKGA